MNINDKEFDKYLENFSDEEIKKFNEEDFEYLYKHFYKKPKEKVQKTGFLHWMKIIFLAFVLSPLGLVFIYLDNIGVMNIINQIMESIGLLSFGFAISLWTWNTILFEFKKSK